jgi:N-formylglutamate deformylase
MTEPSIPPTPYELRRGSAPLLVSVPHAGTWIPDELKTRLVGRAALLEDTDWYIDRLYDFAAQMGASMIVARASRYVVDLNRPPENAPMYPGVNNTELCPTRFFTGEPLYAEGQAPDEAEVQRRVQAYWVPYHDALKAELRRIKTFHGHAVLFDAHSIKSELPWLFEGRLWDLNLGTVNGGSCDPELRAAVVDVLQGQSRYSQVVDRRFKGGYITRQYGRPAQGIHAIQLEMAWRCYMDEAPPYDWNPARAAQIRPLLEQLVRTMRDWKPR